ncbi:MAG: glycerol-3-phosphate 1-O-acyltransferase PlsY [bacterium]
MQTKILLLIVSAYLLGGIPFGLLIAKLWKVDIRTEGSGNIGATNVFRTIGPLPGILVFVLDLLKGFAPVYFAIQTTANHWLIILIGATAIVGHTYPLFLKFKGGKGAATGLGVLLAIAPDIFAGAVITAFIIIYLTRYVSVGSIITVLLVTSAFVVLDKPLPYSLICLIVAILIIIRHIPNIKRLIAGKENKIR